MKVLCKVDECTGCMACLNACQNNVIQVFFDKEGFARPNIDDNNCIDCNMCNKACPLINNINKDIGEQKVYACWTKDKKLRRESSSGGIFTELSKVVLQDKGIVFGAALNEDFEVEHISTNMMNGLEKLRGSKYVQSNIKNTYREAKEYLDRNIPVLYSGTPCQIAGLYGYLEKDYENLYTCDLVCHGVPSPLIYKSYINYLQDEYKSSINSINFRDKKDGWAYYNIKVNFTNGKTYIGGWFKDPFIVGFLKDNFLRPSCYRCKFTNLSRLGDITLADFWGYRAKGIKDRNDNKGISLVILNNEKGKRIFELCKCNLSLFERTIQDAVRYNKCLTESYPIPKTRDDFWKDFGKLKFIDIVQKHMVYKNLTMQQRVFAYFNYSIAKYIVIPIRVVNKLKKVFHL